MLYRDSSPCSESRVEYIQETEKLPCLTMEPWTQAWDTLVFLLGVTAAYELICKPALFRCGKKKTTERVNLANIWVVVWIRDPIDSGIWTLDLQLWALFGRAVEPCLTFHSFSASWCADVMWSSRFLLGPPIAMPSLTLGTAPFWTYKPR